MGLLRRSKDDAGNERWDGLIAHLEGHAGPCQGAEPTDVHGGNRGYDIAFYEADGLTTSVSNGLRFQGLAGGLEIELACTVLSEQAEAGRILVEAVATVVLEKGAVLPWGVPVTNGNPLLTGTLVEGALATGHPSFGPDFDLLRHRRRDALRLVSLIPITRAEIVLIDARGEDALREAWLAAESPIFDVERPSAA